MGDKRVHRVRFVVSSYGTDGIQCTAAIAGLSTIDALIGVTFRTVVANGPVAAIWDDTNYVIKCHKASNSDVNAATAFNCDALVMGS
jgi:hypothetical protein